MEWFVDAIAHRKGDVSREELADHCDAKLLSPIARMPEKFRRWAAAADGAVLESLEVDDPTYVRGYLATRDQRWLIILEVDPATSKLMYLRFDSMR